MKKLIAYQFLSLSVFLVMSSLQASALMQAPVAGPSVGAGGVGGMSYSDQTVHLELNSNVALKAPRLKSELKLFQFNDNPMYGYILINNKKINYQLAKEPVLGKTLGMIGNYYVVIADDDLNSLIKISQATNENSKKRIVKY